MHRRLPLLTRRQFSELVAAASAIGLGGCDLAPLTPPSGPPPPPRFLSDAERSALAVLADIVLPADHEPGGAALGTVTFVDTLLSALETDPPRIYAGGPYSGRQPFADAHG